MTRNREHVSYCVILDVEDVYIERMLVKNKFRTNILGRYKTLEEALECVTRWYEGENNDKRKK